MRFHQPGGYNSYLDEFVRDEQPQGLLFLARRQAGMGEMNMREGRCPCYPPNMLIRQAVLKPRQRRPMLISLTTIVPVAANSGFGAP